ncbi:MAG: hypothetical protein ABSA97_05690 [Verrucomicrobiia bacterium]
MRIRTIWFSFGVAALLLATGCDEVEERMEWSPDGTRAVMRLGDKLCLVDANGNISAPLVSNVESAVWLPDSQGLVLLRGLTVTTWEEATRLLPAEETAVVESLAKGLPDLLKAALAAADGDPEAIGEKFFEPLEMTKNPALLSPTTLYLLDTQPAALRQAFQGCKNPAKLEADLTGDSTTKVAEVSVLLLAGNQPSGQPRAIERTLTGLQQPRPSPSTPVVAFLRDDALMVAPLDGATNRVCVAKKVEGSYDWTRDGKSLVYAVRLTERESSDISLVRIERRTVIDAAGALVAGDTLPLALSGSTFAPRVRCLPDGRVLFAGFQQQLPAPALAAREARFFLIDPSLATNAVAVAIPSAPGALPQDLAYFTPSPDGRQIAIVESGADAVAVLDVATGVLEVASPKRGWKSRILPAWRDADKLYFGALPESSSTRPELLRWHKGVTPQVFSHGWTDEAADTLLGKPSK